MPDPKEILARLTLGVDHSKSYASYEGKRLPEIGASNRRVFRIPGCPYVAKVEWGYYIPSQSWNEWWFWNNVVDGSDHAQDMAATPHLRVEKVTREHYDGDAPIATVSCGLQHYVDGGNAPESYDALYLRLRDAFPHLGDLTYSDQYVYSASRKRWMLVDYGLHLAPRVLGGGAQTDLHERLNDEGAPVILG